MRSIASTKGNMGRCALAACIALVLGSVVKGFLTVRPGTGLYLSSKLTRMLPVPPLTCPKCSRAPADWRGSVRLTSTTMVDTSTVKLETWPYSDILPFLSEHVQPSDQILLLGCGTNLPVMLSHDGYGARDSRSFIQCVDYDAARVEVAKEMAAADPICAKHMADGHLRFIVLDVTGGMPELEQSSFDSVVDFGFFDHLITTQGTEKAGLCLEAAHRAVRLGNPLVAISRIQKSDFELLFDGKWGWMQELDGDPGAVSQWYRGQNVNIKDAVNNFKELGLNFFVYTNVDNC